MIKKTLVSLSIVIAAGVVALPLVSAADQGQAKHRVRHPVIAKLADNDTTSSDPTTSPGNVDNAVTNSDDSSTPGASTDNNSGDGLSGNDTGESGADSDDSAE